MTNIIYKTIVVGAEPAGLALCERLAQLGHQTALITSNLVYLKKQKLDKIAIFEKQAVYLDFLHGLFVVTLSDNTRVCGLSIVFATGTRPAKCNLKNLNIVYKPEDIVGKYKSAQAVVYGKNDFAVKSALTLAKQFRYVYLCNDTFELNCSKTLLKKLNNTKNIVYLPNSGILSCKNSSDGKLSEVILQTYNSIHASALLVAADRVPDLPAVFKRFIGIKKNSFADVSKGLESFKVPNVYAIGGLVEKSSTKSINCLADSLFHKFKEDKTC